MSNRHWDPVKLAVLLVSLALAGAALGADPQCVDATAADPGQLLDCTGGCKLCTPLLDIEGQPLVDGEITSCTLSMDGNPYATVQTTRPGAFYLIPGPSTGPKRRVVSADCTGPAGNSEATSLYDALVRRVRGGKPLILK